MKRFLKFTGASLKMTYREKIALFWMFMFPLILMLLLGAIFGRSGQANISLGVVDLDGTQATQGVIGALGSIKAFSIEKGTQKDLLKKLSDGRLNAVLVLDKGFLNSIEQGKPGQTTIYVDQSSVTVADITYSAVSQVMQNIANRMASAPELIRLEKKSVTSSELSYVDFIVPGILAMTLMTGGLLGLNLDFVAYREKGILRRIKVSPVPLSRFLGAELVAALLMALIQASILLAVGKLVFKIHIRGNPLYIAVIVLMGAASFLALGFLISSLAGSLKTAQMAANAITFPLMFLSGVFFPLSILPNFLATIAKMLPLYYLGQALRQVMILGKGLGSVWVDMVIVVGMGIACFLASMRMFRWE
jgi:ABC-2 type transport system permease protein